MLYSCPVCEIPLQDFPKYVGCDNQHVFDKSKQGYINLLLSNQKKSLQPGDNADMVKSRLQFLQNGFYEPIAAQLNLTFQKHFANKANIVDIGCGIGYYLNYLKQHHAQHTFYGVDISKEAIHCAAQKYKSISWAVGSALHLPYLPASIQCALLVFAPFYLESLDKILTKDAKVMIVTPNDNHLIEMRTMLFEEVEIKDQDKVLEKVKPLLQLIEVQPLKYMITLKTKEDIENLLKMTPFYWRVSQINKDKLLSLNELKITIDVNIWCFEKILDL